MIIFLWPTFNLFAHVSATCNGSVRERKYKRERGRERQCFSLASISPLVSIRIYFRQENCQPVA